jgi:hypothetical protein
MARHMAYHILAILRPQMFWMKNLASPLKIFSLIHLHISKTFMPINPGLITLLTE